MSREALSRKRVWTVRDFATWMGGDVTRRQALAVLEQLDAEVRAETGRHLLRSTRGAARRYWFFRGELQRAYPEAFEERVGIESRLESVEEIVEELRRDLRGLAAQTGANTRELARRTRRTHRQPKEKPGNSMGAEFPARRAP